MEHNIKKKTVQTNTVYNIIKTFSTILYPLITFPYISRVLMPENVGKVNFGNSIISYFSLVATLGISTYATRECSKVKKEQRLLSQTASEIFTINCLSTLIAYIGLAILLIYAKSLSSYRILICIQSITILFTTLGADWLNTAMEDFKFITVRTVMIQIVSIVLMLICVRHPEDYYAYAIISVLASSGSSIINVFYRKKYCKIRFTLSPACKKHLKSIVMMFSITLSQTIYCNSDITMLGLFRGDYEVGLYSTSVKIYNLVNSTVASIIWVVLPSLSSAFSENNYTKVSKYLNYALNFILVLGLPCIVGINAIARPLLCIIGGLEYAEANISLHILSISLFFSFLGGWVGNMSMLPAGREVICLKASVTSALVNVALNFILIPIFGLNAAAATTAIAEFVGFVFLIRYFDNNIQIGTLSTILKAPLIGCCGIVLSAAVVNRFLDSNFAVVLVTTLVSITIYTITMVLLQNEFAMSFIKPILNKIKRG